MGTHAVTLSELVMYFFEDASYMKPDTNHIKHWLY